MFDIRRKKVLFEKWLHHFFEIIFPFGAMGFSLMLVFIPGMQMCKFMNSCYQEGKLIQIIVDGNAVTFVIMRRAVVAELAVAVPGNLELAFKVVDPSADERSGIGRKVFFKNFYFIQFCSS